MKPGTAIVLFASTAGLIGCITTNSKNERGVDYAHKVRVLEKALGKSKSRLEDLEHRNLVLESKLKMKSGELPIDDSVDSATAPFPDKEENKIVSAITPQTPVSAAAVLKATKPAPKRQPEPTRHLASGADLGEQMIYSKIIETYRMREVNELKKSVQLLLKAYPDSVYADNALYLSGTLAFELGDYAYAKNQMDRVVKEFPSSNKVVSALMAIAIIEKKAGRYNDARATLHTIQKKFPGSPEALRVSVELKLLDFTSSNSKRRET